VSQRTLTHLEQNEISHADGNKNISSGSTRGVRVGLIDQIMKLFRVR
jgi:hypothetical protein